MMLRVKQQKDTYSVVFRHKERLFGKEFLFGFTLALLIHLVGFLLFRIVAHPNEPSALLTPLHVEVDMGRGKLAQTDFVSPLEPITLPIYQTPHFSLPNQKTVFDFGCQEPDFSSIEVIDYESLYIDFDDDQD